MPAQPTLQPAHADRLDRFEIETPSWGYADTGTRFGKFLQDAAALSLEDKLDDAAHVHKLTGCCPTVAVHVLWDFDVSKPAKDAGQATAKLAEQRGIRIGSINPNVFQDQAYKLGSFCSPDAAARKSAIDHTLYCVELMKATKSKLLSMWLADGTNYPGQDSIRARKKRLEEAFRKIHGKLPKAGTMLIEYKPFEPAFYHTDIADWGMAAGFCRDCGGLETGRAKVLVDTGHHLPGCNIEHIVSYLLDENLLGGFHFNDRKYADDDLTMGSIDPYQLFRIFFEIVSFEHETGKDADVAYMVDQSHNLKPKIEAMIQTVMTAQEMFLKALLVDQKKLASARGKGDIVLAESILRDAFYTDTRPMLAEYRKSRKLAENPLEQHRASGYADQAAKDRKPRKKAGGGAYA